MSESMCMATWGAVIVGALALLAAVAQFAREPVETFVFYTFAGAMVASSIAIVLSRSIVRAAVWLLGTLGSAAALYLLLAANFLAAVQLIVYAGGILVLIVFGVMLTGRSPFLRFEPKPVEVVVACGAGAVLLSGLLIAMLAWPWPAVPGAAPTVSAAPIRQLGHALLTDYLVPFELVSVLLLAVMIGAAYLARPQRG